MKKKFFTLYNDYRKQFELLSGDQVKELMLAIFDYNDSREIKEIKDPMVKMAFSFIKHNLDKEYEKYKSIRNRNKANGLKGGRPKNPEKPKKPSGLSGLPEKPVGKEFSHKKVYEHYLSKNNLIKHKKFTREMKNCINIAKKRLETTDTDMCKLIDRHSLVVENAKNNEFPVKARSIQEFFGQKVYQGNVLICSEYQDDGKKWQEYQKPRKNKSKAYREDNYEINV